MTHFTVIRQQERERRERLEREAELDRERRAAEQREQQRLANLQNQWAQYTLARPHDLLAAHQRQNYAAKLQALNSIARLINNE